MKNITWTLLILVGLNSCDNTPMTKTVREGEPNIYSTSSDDMDMNKAITTAKKTLDTFKIAFASNKYDTSTFALKIKFPTADGNEHIWVTNLTFENGHFFGTVDNLPDLTTKVKLGDKIKLDEDDVSDWMYSDNGTLRGGYTIKCIRNQMNEEDRKKFDADFPFKISD